ncbi:MAG: N-acetylmuramoyl-L-alanine amidase [Succinivibrionaceae bacterium]|nr:N-acetylmuramoyl-L-alanine amidase [Succinivibrionaceae bacterium]
MGVLADAVTGLRAYSNHDKTRVVFDLDYRARFSSATKDGQLVVRINGVSRPAAAPRTLRLDKRSPLSSVTREISGNDLRYVFTLKGEISPHLFLLKPQDGRNYRLVLDVPHASAPAPLHAQVDGGAGTAPAKVVTRESADRVERRMVQDFGHRDSEGFTVLTPAEIKAYEDKIREIRKQQEEDRRAAALARQQGNPSPGQEIDEQEVPTAAAPPTPVAVRAVARPFIIAVDPGHGGKDPGAIGSRGVKEKNVTLGIARALASYINSNRSFRAYLTRSKDRFIELNLRSELARKHQADVLISIHADSVASKSQAARGVSVWVLNNNRAQRENNKVLSSDATGDLLGGAGEVLSNSDEQNPYLAATILDMTSENTRSEGYLLGREILASLGKFTRLSKSVPIHASLAVLKAPDIPSLLIETGFLSNRYEEIQLNQPNYQKQIAYRIYLGLKSYYEKYPAQHQISRAQSAEALKANHTHVVKRGETLSTIARDQGVPIKSLRRLNGLKSDQIRVGQVLILRQ